MIRIYPSRLQGEPLESHPIAAPIIFADWIKSKAPEFALDREHPICADVDGVPLPPEQWGAFVVQPDTDLRIYPMARATGAAIAGWAALAISVVALVYTLTLDTDTGTQPGQGENIETNPAKANQAKPNEPVREVLGRYRVYPDYVTRPVTRFVNKREMHSTMCTSVGAGSHLILASSIKIGDTPIAAFGSDVEYAIYEPGTNLSADVRSENWYLVGEVGGTDAGTSGLDLASTAPSGSGVVADALVLGGNSVSIAGDDAFIPETWDAGTIVILRTPNTYEVSSSGGYSVVAGQLDDLSPFVGMKVTLGADNDYDLIVNSFSPYVAPVAGTGGSPAMVTGGGAPSSYDFTGSPIVFNVDFQGDSRTITLAADYANMSGVVSEVTAQMGGLGLVAQDYSGVIRLIEPFSPYQGGGITLSNAPVSLFGVGTMSEVGTASSGGTPEQLAFITLRYESGEPFAGLPDGAQRLSLGYRGEQFRLSDIDGLTLTLDRLTDAGAVDGAWPGFGGRTILDFVLQSDESGSYNWVGPFNAYPEEEATSVIEYDIYIPSGLASYSSKGRRRATTVQVIVEWRDAYVGGDWTTVTHTLSDSTEDAIGFTYKLNLPYAMRPQFRMRRAEPQSGGSTRDTVYWYGLRCRLNAPTRYDDVTIMTMKVRTGDRLSAQSDRRINLMAERIYSDGSPRSIYGAAMSVLDGLGISRDAVDVEQIAALESAFWTPRGETYDFAHIEESTAREVLQQIFAAGMGHISLTGGLIGAIREGVQPHRGTITPQEMTGELRSSFTAYGPDDFDGVDVEFISPQTWSKETVECRLPGSLGLKVDTIRLDGVLDRTRAWRIGMRQLRKHVYQRWVYDGETEMDALCYERMDHIVLADDIPGTTTTALIVDAEYEDGDAVLTVSEPLDWSVPSPRIIIRRHDGSATPLLVPEQVSEYQLRVAEEAIDFDLITDLSIEPARLLFAASTQVGYSAMFTDISPGGEGTCSFTAAEYRDDFYADDNNTAPADA